SNYWVDVVFNTSTTVSSSSSVSSLQTTELQEKEDMIVYPNPFTEKATVSFILSDGGNYMLSLYDAKGAQVAVLEQGVLQSGVRRSVEVDGTKLAKGLYLVRLQTSSEARTVRLILDR
ncbi:T9SS type A sorting domain-containing protein, partial [Pontibacter toksunensis]